MASLLLRPGDAASGAVPAASLLADLRLDEIAQRLSGGRDVAWWAALLATPLPDADAVAYRQDVFRDLEDGALAAAVQAFVAGMSAAHADAARAVRMYHPMERDRWRLAAMANYTEAADALLAGLVAAPVRSRAFRAVRDDLRAYTTSDGFAAMRDDVRAAVDGLAAVRYRLRIGEHRIVVGAPADERSYLAELEDLFARFRSVQDAPRAEDGFESIDMRPLEAQILERVAKLAPGPLAAMTAAVQRHAGFMDPALERLAAEAAFYLGWLQLLAPLRGSGLGWCLPSVDPSDGAVSIDGAFDLALAVDLTRWGEPVVANTVHLAPDERVAVITGPNRTGKTALARAMGQIHLLAAAGCPVPAVAARVPLVDAVYTQADRAEGLGDPGGRLELDLRQVVSILRDLTPRGLVIFNEPFASTTVDDALELSRTVLDDVRRLGARAVVVTFLHELAGDAASVSLVCGAADGGAAGAAATAFQMRRAPAEGLAHAHTVAARYGLTADDVRKRVAR